VLSWDGVSLQVPVEVSEEAWIPADAEPVVILTPWASEGLQQRLTRAGVWGLSVNKHGHLVGSVRPQDRAAVEAAGTLEGLVVLPGAAPREARARERFIRVHLDRSARGPLSPEGVLGAVLAQPEWSRCMPHMTGTRPVVLTFSVGPDGTQQSLAITTTGSIALRSCLRPELEAVRFPATGASSKARLYLVVP
jgi:hypothetical protein